MTTPMFDESEMRARAERARELMDAQGIDVLLATGDFSAGLNYYWFSGHQPRDYQLNFSRPHIMVLPRDGEPFLWIYNVNEQNARDLSWVADVVPYNPPFIGVDLAKELTARGFGDATIGAELGTDHRLAMPAAEFSSLVEALPDATFVDAGPLIWQLRMIKSDAELDYIRQADHINGEAHRLALARIKPGDSEVDVARAYGMAFVECGAVRPPYGQILVVSEAKSRALGHRARMMGPLAEFTLADGDLLFVDSGVVVEGYWGEFNRMGVVGDPTPAKVGHHDAIREIIRRAMAEALVPGRPFREIMEQMVGFALDLGYTRDHLAQYVGPPFFHLCHGIGLTSSEPPFVRMDSEDVLEPGMVLSVEAYIRADDVTFGSEEDVIITADGCDVFSDTDPGLIPIGVDR
ncbi:M24 family metallopeptidase [Euzebya sp.]|uniref:M24 family metallopeptidase n=1 Tax=Euzebya sp. TaxID=1971409 RepID=UPI003515C1A9